MDMSQLQNDDLKVVYPSCIIVDERSNGAQDQAEKTETQAKSPFSLRFLCFLGLIFCSIFGLGMILMSALTTVLAVAFLFRKPSLNQAMGHFWKLATHTTVAGLGFVLGLISPTLGLGLIALYFSITGQAIENNLLYSIIKQSFGRF